jgi:uncharacterized protein YeaC (DUF1315 family)
VDTVLASITADVFREFSEAIEAGEKPRAVAQRALKKSWKVRSAAVYALMCGVVFRCWQARMCDRFE